MTVTPKQGWSWKL